MQLMATNSIRIFLSLVFLTIALGCGLKEKNIVTEQEHISDIKVGTPAPITDEVTNEPSHATNKEYGFTSPSNVVAYSSSVADSTSVYLADGDNSAYNPLGSSASSLTSDTSRKFIKTADLKFRVKSAIQATYQIEDLTHKFGGFVSYTNLESRIDGTTLVPVSRDSSLETIYYTVTNSITIRVPQAKLDSLLRSFTPLVDYLDHRTIEVQDVYLDMLRNRLTQDRVKKYQDRVKIKIDTKGRDLDQIATTEESIIQRQEEADNAKIETLAMMDRIEYSTVSLYIYQRQAIKRELVFNNKNVDAYDPGFGYKLKQSVASGWKGFVHIILFFVQFWIVVVLAGAAFVAFRILRRRAR
jgi:hypothetical protein